MYTAPMEMDNEIELIISSSNDNLIFDLAGCEINGIEDESIEIISIDVKEYNYESDTKRDVAYIELQLFDEQLSDRDLLIIADECSQDVTNSMSAYIDSKFRREYEALNINEMYQSSFSGVLHTFYVVPEYRNRGLFSSIINNMADILYKNRRYILHHLMAYPRPFSIQTGSDIPSDREYDDSNIVMKEHMTNQLIKNEFVAINDSNYYIREYFM